MVLLVRLDSMLPVGSVYVLLSHHYRMNYVTCWLNLPGSYALPMLIQRGGISSLLVASRLIALSKVSGVRPIGVGEVCQCIIGKAILQLIKLDVLEVAGYLQMCAGLDSGCEVAVHCIRKLYNSDMLEGILCVDASNAFNAVNRQLALRNILHFCPSLGRVVINTYRRYLQLFIDGEINMSKEGTTQSYPLAMSMFAIATNPLIKDLCSTDITQVWYADDASAG